MGGANEICGMDALTLARRILAKELSPGALELAIAASYHPRPFEQTVDMYKPVEDLGGGELRLQDRDIKAVAGLAVGSREGMWQEPQPFAQQGIDLGGGKPVANRLQALGVGTPQDAVVEASKAIAFWAS